MFLLNLMREWGEQIAFAYSQLLWSEFKPREGLIMLHFSTHTVHLHGHRLQSLYAEILKREVEEVRLTGERHQDAVNDGPVVTRIDVNETKSKGETFKALKVQPDTEGD
ncbi:MAG: hypothetical protein IPM33_02090 [Phycisphaerales bacterium]|nr:hypothetical protein [Phycisphaerales bacterium]